MVSPEATINSATESESQISTKGQFAVNLQPLTEKRNYYRIFGFTKMLFIPHSLDVVSL